jgi:hypothetical protein
MAKTMFSFLVEVQAGLLIKAKKLKQCSCFLYRLSRVSTFKAK